MAEQGTLNPKVEGSNPSGRTTILYRKCFVLDFRVRAERTEKVAPFCVIFCLRQFFRFSLPFPHLSISRLPMEPPMDVAEASVGKVRVDLRCRNLRVA